MNYRTYALCALALLVVVAASLLSDSPKQESEVTIGVLVPLTGKSASVGERVKAGVERALSELAQEGETSLKVIFEDDKGEAAPAVSAAQKLIQNNKVRIIIGTVKSDAMLAVAPITEKEKIILISPTAGAARISQAGDYVFRLIELPNIHGEAGAQELSGQKVALFIAQAANAKSYGDAFRTAHGADNIVYEVEYQQDASDFRTDVAKAKTKGASAYYLAVATAKDAGVLVKQIRESGFSGNIMMSVAADATEFFDAAGVYAEGAKVSAPYFDPGRFSDGFTANGYDAVMLLADAIDECEVDTDCIRDFLYNTQDYRGAGGTLSFDKNGDVTKPVLVKSAHEGSFIVEK